MDSSVQEMSNPTPREVDLFAEEALEEVFETIDNLRSQFDQLQIHCEKLAAEKAKVDQLVIDKETEWQLSKERLQEEIGNLRKVNLQLLASQKSFNQGVVRVHFSYYHSVIPVGWCFVIYWTGHFDRPFINGGYY